MTSPSNTAADPIIEVWLCEACDTWNRCDYHDASCCVNCRRSRDDSTPVSAMPASAYVRQIRYFGFDLWGTYQAHVQRQRLQFSVVALTLWCIFLVLLVVALSR